MMFFAQNIVEDRSIIEKIKSFSSYETGWNMGTGMPIPKQLIEYAISFVETVNTLTVGHKIEQNASPYGDSGIILTFGVNEDFIDVIFEDNKALTLIHERGKGSDYQVIEELEDANITDFTTRLLSLCKSSDQYIQVNTIHQKEDSTAIYSKTIKDLYQYLKKNAQSVPAETYPNTSRGSTNRSQVVLSYI